MKKIILAAFVGLSCLACQKITQLDYIPFKAGFQAPQVVRIGEQIRFAPDGSTAEAQNFLWEFGDLKKRTSSEQNPLFAYDTLGEYTAKLTVKMDKKGGVKTDAFTRNIFVLPTTKDSLTTGYKQYSLSSQSSVDEIGMSVAPVVTGALKGSFFVAAQQGLHKLMVSFISSNPALSPNWTRTFSDFGEMPIYPKSIIATNDGGCLIAGYTEFGLGDSDAFVMKLNSSGNKMWDNTDINSSNFEQYRGAVQIDDNTYAVVGSMGKNATSAVLAVHLLDNDGHFVQQYELGQFKNCHINQMRKGIFTANFKEYYLVGKWSDQPILIKLNGSFSPVDFVKINAVGEATAFNRLGGGELFITGKGYTKGNATLEDSTAYAFGARYESISDASYKWISKVKMYREKNIDSFVLDSKTIVCLGEHYNPVSNADLLFTKIDVESGKVTAVRLLGDNSEHKPVAMFYNPDTGNVVILATTREISSDITSHLNMCVVQVSLTKIFE